MGNLQDVAAERAVLAAIFTFGGNAYLDVADIVGTNSFTVDSNQVIWTCLDYIFKKDSQATVDLPTVLSSAHSLGLSGMFEAESEKTHLRAIMNFPVKSASVRSLAATLAKLEFTRNAKSVVGELYGTYFNSLTGTESIQSIISGIENPILEISSSLTGDDQNPTLVGEGLADYLHHLATNQKETIGIPTGYKEFDEAIGGGLRNGGVTFIAARPKTGKTVVCTNMAMRIASGAFYEWPKFNPEKGIPVLQIDTEMVKTEQWVRQVACVSAVDSSEIEKGKYYNDARKRRAVDNSERQIDSWPYHFINVSGQQFDQTEAMMRRWVTRTVGLDDNGKAKPCVIFFDYLKLMDSSSMESKKLAEYQVLGFMMTRLHNFAVKYQLPIVAFGQLNRDGVDGEDESVIASSDRILWLCHNASIFKTVSDVEIVNQMTNKKVYNRKMILLATRFGAGLAKGDYINYAFAGSMYQLEEGKTRNQSKSNSSNSKPTGLLLDDPEADFDPVPFGR